MLCIVQNLDSRLRWGNRHFFWSKMKEAHPSSLCQCSTNWKEVTKVAFPVPLGTLWEDADLWANLREFKSCLFLIHDREPLKQRDGSLLNGDCAPTGRKLAGRVKGQILHLRLLSKGVTYLCQTPINSLPSNVSEPELQKCIKRHIVWRTFEDINLYKKEKKRKKKEKISSLLRAWKIVTEIYP